MPGASTSDTLPRERQVAICTVHDKCEQYIREVMRSGEEAGGHLRIGGRARLVLRGASGSREERMTGQVWSAKCGASV